MALPVEKTLQTLRAELQARLGFTNQGLATTVQDAILNSFLIESQIMLYDEFAETLLLTITNVPTALGQTFYDWPADCDPLRLVKIDTEVVNAWLPVTEGIGNAHDTVVGLRSYPTRYEVLEQLRIWPEPDQVYPLRLRYIRRLGPFTDNTHRATIDSSLVLLNALVPAKEHYRQPFQAIAVQLSARLGVLRAKQHATRRYPHYRLKDDRLIDWHEDRQYHGGIRPRMA